MFTRTTGWFIVPLWLAAMSWLVSRDVLPGISAGDPPPLRVTAWSQTNGVHTQYDILGPGGVRLGTGWTTYRIADLSIVRSDWVLLDHPKYSFLPLRVQVDSVYTAAGLLDEFTAVVEARETRAKLHGERFHSDFAYVFDGYIANNHFDTRFKTPLVDGSSLTSGLQPFGPMTGLEVGRTWRVQVFNPMYAVLGMGKKFLSMLMRVSGKERKTTRYGSWDCFVVQSTGAKAWVDETGIVRAQEVNLPMLGTIQLIPAHQFDRDAFNAAMRFRM